MATTSKGADAYSAAAQRIMSKHIARRTKREAGMDRALGMGFGAPKAIDYSDIVHA